MKIHTKIHIKTQPTTFTRYVLCRGETLRRHVSNINGIVMVWTSMLLLAFLVFIALGLGMLSAYSSSADAAQVAEYYAEATMRKYIQLATSSMPENQRRKAAQEYGQQVADNLNNKVLQAIAPTTTIVKIEFGFWDLSAWETRNGSQNAYDAYFKQDPSSNDPACNAIRLHVSQTIQSTPFSVVFHLDSPSLKPLTVSASAISAYDKRLYTKGFYPYLVRLRF